MQRSSTQPSFLTLLVLISVCQLAAPAFGQVDLYPPSFEILGSQPSVVNVTNGPAQTEVIIHVRDDATGLSSGSIVIVLADTGLKWFFDNNSLVSGVPTDGIYRVQIDFPQGAPPGNREIAAIVFDGAGRSFYGSPDDKFIQVVNNGPFIDYEPPALHNVTITPQVLDLTDGPGIVTVEFDVSDDATGVNKLEADFLSPIEGFNPDSRKFVWYRATTGNERRILRGTYPFGAYTPSGEWRLELEQMFDGVARSSPYDFGAEAYYRDFDAILTIINPNEDLDPPVLESVVFPDPSADTSYGEVAIPFSLRVKDAASGLMSISVRLHPPSGAEYIYSYTRPENELAGSDPHDISLDKDFIVPPFIEEGTWKVSVRLSDNAGHYITYGHGSTNPLPPGSTTSVEIKNLFGVDNEDVQLTDFSYSPNPVDVTDRSQIAELFFSFTDNLSGFERATVRIESPDEEFGEYIYMDAEDLVSGNLNEGVVRAFFQIPHYSEPGEWKIESFSMSDRAGNYTWFVTYPVFVGGLPNSITVKNTGSVDRQKPELIDFSLPMQTVDVTSGDQRPTIEVSAWDDFSGVDHVYFTFEMESTGDQVRFFPGSSDLVSTDGNVSRFEDYILLRAYQPPGEYMLTRIDVEDKLGRKRSYKKDDPDDPIPSEIPQSITVVNNGAVDYEKPAFNGIRISQTDFDVTDASRSFVVEIDYTDDSSGLSDIEVRMSEENGVFNYTLFDSWLDDDVYQVLSGSPTSGTVQAVCTIPRFIPPGRYTLSYEVTDQLRRSTSLAGSSSSFPYPDVAAIEVRNDGSVDWLEPRLVNFQIPESVDVTNLAAEIPVTVSYLDDLTGIQELSVYLESPGGDLISHSVTGQELTGGTAEEGSFSFLMTIPAFSEAGSWEVRCFYQDGLERLEYLYADEMEALGFPSSFNIVNRQPVGYLWRECEAYADNWRYQDWFGWLQDPQSYPYVYHLEHGWIFTSGTDSDSFYCYDSSLKVWWWVNKNLYPYIYASGRLSGWFYYYAPYGRPGQRWFYDLTSHRDVPEAELRP